MPARLAGAKPRRDRRSTKGQGRSSKRVASICRANEGIYEIQDSETGLVILALNERRTQQQAGNKNCCLLSKAAKTRHLRGDDSDSK
jgi:hypothetical protein